ncbi:MAG: hypothetical protein WBD96_04450, partial [Pseudolabrys sp.]
ALSSLLVSPPTAEPQLDVRFGSKADMCSAARHVRFGSKADMCSALGHVRFVPIADMLNKLSGKYSERKSAFLRFFRVWGPMECT